ncbi:MAG: hypothetical protein AAGD25_38450 [Cyanobacteria bacterium P01_F01_bin.150]
MTNPKTGLSSSRYGLIIAQLPRFVPQVAEWLSDFGFWSLSIDSYIWRPDIMFQPYRPGVFTPTACAEDFAASYAASALRDGTTNCTESYIGNHTANYIANYAANTVAVSTTMLSASAGPRYEPVRHMIFGSIGAVQNTIKLLYVLNYAEPNDWSHPVPSGQPCEVMVVLTKKVRLG